MKWKIIKSETAFKNHFFKITKDKCKKSDGDIVENYYTIHRPTVAVIAALTEKNELVLVNQYRHPVKNTDIELPAGYIENNENIEQAAHRELLEETGYKVEKMEEIHEVYSSAGLMDNNIHFFIGFNAKKIQEPQLDENEELEVLIKTLDETMELLKQKKIMDMASVTGILLINEYLKKTMKRQIYMDHAATTYTDQEVLDAMLPYFTEKYGNPESQHTKGKEAMMAIDNARETVANILNCRESEVVFCGTATEANNLAIFGTARANHDKGNHLITLKIEHGSILEPYKKLEKEGFEITMLDVDKEGFVNPKEVERALTPKTTLVSIMYANNEIGTIEPIKEIGTILSKHQAYFHTDACQIAGVRTLDTKELKVDMMTLNGSKIYGPKGVGVLYVKRDTKIEPIIYGGTHENNMRGGTHNTPNIVGFAKALELIEKNKDKEYKRLEKLRDKAIKALLEKIPRSYINGPLENRLPNNINITIPGLSAQEILLHLDDAGIYASIGAACRRGTERPSVVLKAIGLDTKDVLSALRFSFGKRNTEEDVDYLIETLPKIVEKLRNS